MPLKLAATHLTASSRASPRLPHLQVIYSREPDTPVPSDVKARFSAAVAAAGLQDYVKLDSFCTPAYPSTCPNL